MSTVAAPPEEEFPRTRLVLIRHGESNANATRTIGGHRSCTGLSDLGRRQCARLATRLAETVELADVALYASQYPRAIETAEILAPSLGHAEVHVEAGFGEHDPGPECDGLSYDEFITRHGWPDWESDPYAITFPGGETVADLHHRVGATIAAVTGRHRGGSIVAACHGGVVNAALRMALHVAPTGGFELYTTNAAITELLQVRPGRWRVLRVNDSSHLAGLPASSSSA